MKIIPLRLTYKLLIIGIYLKRIKIYIVNNEILILKYLSNLILF